MAIVHTEVHEPLFGLAARAARKLLQLEVAEGVFLGSAERTDGENDGFTLFVLVDDDEAELYRKVTTGDEDPGNADYRKSYAELSSYYRGYFGDDGEFETDSEYALRRLGFATPESFYNDIRDEMPLRELEMLEQRLCLVLVGEDWPADAEAEVMVYEAESGAFVVRQ